MQILEGMLQGVYSFYTDK